MDKEGRAVFLDRDGVINEIVRRDGRPASPRTLDEFRFVDDVDKALKRLRGGEYRLFVVSNQPDVTQGLLAQSALEQMTHGIKTSMPIDRVMTCIHDDHDGCTCRKPKPGMLHEVAVSEGIDLFRSFVIGDSWKDVQAGRNAGCATILLRREYNRGVEADYSVENMAEAVDLILGETNHGDTNRIIRGNLS